MPQRRAIWIRHWRTALRFLVCCVVAAAVTQGRADQGARPIKFNRHIRPILADKCFRCHGPDPATRQADLRLDDPQAALAPKTPKPVIRAGHPEESLLIERIASPDPDLRMPPADSGLTLSPGEIDRLRQWIAAGAEYQPHWAFIPPRAGQTPAVVQAAWMRNPIDRHVLARLEAEGLSPSPEASRETLLRRVTLDLTGLPPTEEELDAFLADDSPGAWDRVVDGLLGSPRYGEQMAVPWLDAARYSDTDGYFTDAERKMWRWRDGLIRALNANQSFDQFTVEQLAGDLLPEPTLEQQVASGFHRNYMMNNETGIIDEEFRLEYVADRTDTTGAVWLGLTLGCARCHDHKYDPISQREYYQIFACFNNLPEKGLIYSEVAPEPSLTLVTEEERAARETLRQERTACEQQFAVHEPALVTALAEEEAQSLTVTTPTKSPRVTFLFDKDLCGTGIALVEGSAVGPIRHKDGFLGSALEFDGSQQVAIPASAAGEVNGPWTISLWIRPLAQSGATITASGTPDAPFRGLRVGLQRLHVSVELVADPDKSLVSVVALEPLVAGRWQHVAIVHDGLRRAGGIGVFVDGLPQAVRVHADGLSGQVPSGHPWRVGGFFQEPGLNGRIDELRLYSENLSAQEAADRHGEELVQAIRHTAADKRSAAQKQQLMGDYIRRRGSEELRALWQRLSELRRREAGLDAQVHTTLVMREMQPPRSTFILQRGQYDKPGDQVSPGALRILPPWPTGEPSNRLGLARWLVTPGHPLTSRVAVNRWWQQFFGEGLVRTTGDFGVQGEWPSHPELLDWLALRFEATGWDVKALHRLIVTSATYRQSSACSPALRERDPDNRLLARGPRNRLSAEAIRDQALAVGGLLVEELGGRSVKPWQPPGLWEAVSYNAEQSYVPDRGRGQYRRSLYTFWKRQAPPPAMLSFDGPTRETCLVKRSRTNTPLQALVLQNDPAFLEASRGLAAHLLETESQSDQRRMQRACRSVLGRVPDADELARLLALLAAQRQDYDADPRATQGVLSVGDFRPRAGLNVAELAAWTTVISVLLNLDEAVTRP
ncbi:MAG: DUF1553 domain-containing protein [Planctomycetales bacterium]